MKISIRKFTDVYLLAMAALYTLTAVLILVHP